MVLLTYASLVFTMLLWGGTFIAGRLLADSVEPANAAFLRFAIASLALLGFVILKERKLPLPPRSTWLALFLLGITGVFLYNVFFFSGLQHIGAGRAALFIASTPLVITLAAAVIFKEKITAIKTTGVFLSLLGALIVISNGSPGSFFSGGFGVGEMSLMGCVFSWSAYSLIGRSVLKKISALTSVCYSSIIGTCLLFIPALKAGLLDTLPTITGTGWLSLAYLGLLGTAVGFSLYYDSIKKIGASRSAIFINLVPLFSLVLASLILDEYVKTIVLLGGLLILAGVSLTNYQPKPAANRSVI